MSRSSESAPMHESQTFQSVASDILDLSTRKLNFEVGLSLVRQIGTLLYMDPYAGYDSYRMDGVSYDQPNEAPSGMEHENSSLFSGGSYRSGPHHGQGEWGQGVHTPGSHTGYQQPAHPPPRSHYSQPASFSNQQQQNFAYQPQPGSAGPHYSHYSAPTTPITHDVVQPYTQPNQAAPFAAPAPNFGAQFAHVHNNPQPSAQVPPIVPGAVANQQPPNLPIPQRPQPLIHPQHEAPPISHSTGAEDLGDFDDASSDVEVIESQVQPNRYLSVRDLVDKLVLSPEELDFALKNVKDGDPVGLWESLRMAQVIFGPDAPDDRYLQVLRPPKTPNADTPLAPVWKIVNSYSCGGGRSDHLVVKHFRGDHETYKRIVKLNAHTGGDGDGDVESKAGLLEKLRLKIANAKRDGVIDAKANLTPEQVRKWQIDSVGGIFALYDSKLRGSKHPNHDVVECRDGQPSSSAAPASVRNESRSQLQPHRQASTQSLPRAQSVSSANCSTGPIRTGHSTRGAESVASSPISTHGRLVSRKLLKKGGTSGKVKAEINVPGDDNSATSSKPSLSDLIIENQQAKKKLYEKRQDREDVTKDFLLKATAVSEHVKLMEARAQEVAAIADAIAKLNDISISNNTKLIDGLNELREKSVQSGNQQRVEAIDDRVFSLLTREQYDVDLKNLFSRLLGQLQSLPAQEPSHNTDGER